MHLLVNLPSLLVANKVTQTADQDVILSGPMADKSLIIITFWQSLSILTGTAFLAPAAQENSQTNRMRCKSLWLMLLSHSNLCVLLSIMIRVRHKDERRDERKTVLLINGGLLYVNSSQKSADMRPWRLLKVAMRWPPLDSNLMLGTGNTIFCTPLNHNPS